jgi:hypothetical protein
MYFLKRGKMKSALFLSLLILFSDTSIAQPFGKAAPDFHVIQINYQNSSGEKGKTYFKYDKKGHLDRGLWILDDSSRYSENYYECDINGNVVSAFRDFSDSMTSYEYFDLNSSGDKISEIFIRSDSVTGSAKYQYIDRKLKTAVFDNYKGWLSGTVSYEYNSLNQMIEGKLFRNDKEICRIAYSYDDNGNMTREHWNFNGKWSQTFDYIYKRNDLPSNYYSSPFLSCDSDHRIKSEYYTFNDQIGGPSYYNYNDDGLLVKKVFVRSDSVSTETIYEYDSDGRLVLSKRAYSDKKSAHFTYKYDENDDLILRKFFKGDSLIGFESYLYNNDGELIKAYLHNFDEWLTGIISFENSFLGKVNSARFIGKDGINADILFDYDNDGLLRTILWRFFIWQISEI